MSSSYYSAKNFVHGWYKGAMEYVTPVSDKSEFSEKGVLTPEEFVKAGNQLVYRCPTWQWEGGSSKKRWSFLPAKQQFLSTRGVPCAARVKSLILSAADEEEIEDGEWLAAGGIAHGDAHAHGSDSDIEDIEDMDDIDDIEEDLAALSTVPMPGTAAADSTAVTTGKTETVTLSDTSLFTGSSETDKSSAIVTSVEESVETKTDDCEDDDDDSFDSSFEEIPDLDTFDDTDNIVDAATALAEDAAAVSAAADGEHKTVDTDISHFVKTRTYDLSIAYDKHYRVPRLWLRGYDEKQMPLTSTQIMEDISADHAHKTVTVEKHPHLKGVICASIHPCRHSEVMKRFMDIFESQGTVVSVEDYMFIFLKFMSGVIPTVDYDYTQTVGS